MVVGRGGIVAIDRCRSVVTLTVFLAVHCTNSLARLNADAGCGRNLGCEHTPHRHTTCSRRADVATNPDYVNAHAMGYAVDTHAARHTSCGKADWREG